MAETIQCSNCGAILHEDDLFCGECSAPRAPSTAPVDVPDEPQANVPPSPPARRSDPERAWLVAAAVLGTIAVLLCVLGILAFVLIGIIPAEDVTQTEGWLISATCCLLPIGGAGAVAGIAALVIWWSRLRNR